MQAPYSLLSELTPVIWLVAYLSHDQVLRMIFRSGNREREEEKDQERKRNPDASGKQVAAK